MEENKLSRLEVYLLISGFVLLFITQLFYNRPPFSDEYDYLNNVPILHQYGFGQAYLKNLIGSAGPLYSIVHFLLEPLTGLKAPYVRWVNLLFLAGNVYMTYRTLRLFHHLQPLFSLYIMAVPMIYVIGGLALTEMPAMFFLSIAVYLVVKNSLQQLPNATFNMVVAGFCMSLAIIGRQPFLLLLAAFPVLFIGKQDMRKNIKWLAIFTTTALLFPSYVFIVWNGLVPTIESQLYIDIAKAGTSFRPDFFLMCNFYFSLSMLVIAPRFFVIMHSKKDLALLAASFLLLTMANFFFSWIELLPLRAFLEKIFIGPQLLHIVSVLCGSAVIFTGIYFLVCCWYQFKRLRFSREAIFFALSALLVSLACIKITWGYTSRYAGQGIPLLVLFASFFYQRSKYNAGRIIVGVLTGLVAVISYFHNPA